MEISNLVEAVAKRVWHFGHTDRPAPTEEDECKREALRLLKGQDHLILAPNVFAILTALHKLTGIDLESLVVRATCESCATCENISVIPTGCLAKLTALCQACLEKAKERTRKYFYEENVKL